MAEFDIQAVRGALARGYCARGNRGKELDSVLLEAQAAEIMALVERLAEPEIENVEAISATPTDEELRIAAYELVIANGQGGWSDFHKRAGEIYDRLKHGFDSIVQTLTIKLDIDTSDAEKAIAERASLIDRQGQTIERQAGMIQRQRDTISAQREIINSNVTILQSLFERVEWRREAWNDLKAVLVRALTTRLKQHVSGDILRGVSPKALEQFRSFVASYNFDPEKP